MYIFLVTLMQKQEYFNMKDDIKWDANLFIESQSLSFFQLYKNDTINNFQIFKSKQVINHKQSVELIFDESESIKQSQRVQSQIFKVISLGQKPKKTQVSQKIKSRSPIYAKNYRQKQKQKQISLQQQNKWLKKRVQQLQSNLFQTQKQLSTLKKHIKQSPFQVPLNDNSILIDSLHQISQYIINRIQKALSFQGNSQNKSFQFKSLTGQYGIAGRKKVNLLNYHMNQFLQSLLNDVQKYFFHLVINYDATLPDNKNKYKNKHLLGHFNHPSTNFNNSSTNLNHLSDNFNHSSGNLNHSSSFNNHPSNFNNHSSNFKINSSSFNNQNNQFNLNWCQKITQQLKQIVDFDELQILRHAKTIIQPLKVQVIQFNMACKRFYKQHLQILHRLQKIHILFEPVFSKFSAVNFIKAMNFLKLQKWFKQNRYRTQMRHMRAQWIQNLCSKYQNTKNTSQQKSFKKYK